MDSCAAMDVSFLDAGFCALAGFLKVPAVGIGGGFSMFF